MSRSNMGRWIGVCLVGLVTMGCTTINWIAQDTGGVDPSEVSVKPGFIKIENGKASVSPKTITLRSRRQVAIWVLQEGAQVRDDLQIKFHDAEFGTRTDLRCGGRICAMHLPPVLPEGEKKKVYGYDGVITRGDGSRIDLDPQVEVIDF